MTPDEVLSVVRAAVVTVLDVDAAAVTRETRLRIDLKADSLALLEVVERVEGALAPEAPAGFRFEDEDLDALSTVGDLVDYAAAKVARFRAGKDLKDLLNKRRK